MRLAKHPQTILFLIALHGMTLASQGYCQGGQLTYSPDYSHEESQIPNKPSAPPQLNQRTPLEIPHCERYYTYRGKKFECDSNIGKDADRLRPLMQDVPQALNELDIYQENQEKIRVASYLGTVGLLAMIMGIIMSHPPFDPISGAIKPGGFVLLGGGVLAGNSLIYGLSLVKTNESHLGNAVRNYNVAHPDDPIQLQFSTKVNF